MRKSRLCGTAPAERGAWSDKTFERLVKCLEVAG